MWGDVNVVLGRLGRLEVLFYFSFGRREVWSDSAVLLFRSGPGV